jgi:hypothetical protein
MFGLTSWKTFSLSSHQSVASKKLKYKTRDNKEMSSIVNEPECGGGGGFGVSANEYNCAHGAQINLGDLTPYLTYV